MTKRATKIVPAMHPSAHVIRIFHTDSGNGRFEQRVSTIEVLALDPREPTPPREIEWGTVERYNGHVDHHDSPVACTLGVRYTNGLASCLRAWGCLFVHALSTSTERAESDALLTELVRDA